MCKHRSRSQRNRRQRRSEQGRRSHGPAGHSRPTGTVQHWREREEPAATVIWQTVAFFFLAFAIGTGVAALTSDGAGAIQASELWISTGGLLALALVCFLAHWDVNRGRRGREYVLELVPRDDDE